MTERGGGGPDGALFLSFASEDREGAWALAEGLQRVGARVWCTAVPGTLSRGARPEEEIPRAIGSCALFAVLALEAELRDWVLDEINEARERRRRDSGFRIVPILGRTRDPKGLPITLKGFQAVVLTEDPRRMRNEDFRALARELGLVVQEEVEVPIPPTVPAASPDPIPRPPTPLTESGKRLRWRWIVAAGLVIGALATVLLRGLGGPDTGLLVSPEVPLSAPLLKMIPIEGGTFHRGSDTSSQKDERPAQSVTVAPFELSQCEVTREQWETVMGATDVPPEWTETEPNLPANSVTWFQAVSFCNRLSERERLAPYYLVEAENVSPKGGSGYRLPSEAEWEYACRAGTTGDYSFDDPRLLKDYAWFFLNSGAQVLPENTPWESGKLEDWGCRVHPVRAKKANPWDLFDMHGNVWEWCEDTWHPSYEGAPNDGTPWVDEASEGRVLRGGSFEFSAVFARSAYRFGFLPSFRWHDVGFRPARSVTTD